MDTVVEGELRAKIEQLKLIILDVDGVMTDGAIICDGRGGELKSFNVRDGFGIKLAQRSGVDVAIITARSSEAVAQRARELGIELLIQGAVDKLGAYEEILDRTGLAPEQTAFVGDDLIDLPVLVRVGFSATVPDAPDEVKSRVDYVTRARGGHGAVREVVELVLKVKGLFGEVLKQYGVD